MTPLPSIEIVDNNGRFLTQTEILKQYAVRELAIANRLQIISDQLTEIGYGNFKLEELIAELRGTDHKKA